MIRHPHNFLSRRPRRTARGFTLIEAALTTTIVGVGLLAMLQLIAAGTTANISGAQTTTAVNMAKSIREMSLKMSFDEVRAMDGTMHTPPVDSRGMAMAGFDDWIQVVDVQTVDPDRLTADTASTLPHAVRVTVTVVHNGRNVSEMSWYRMKPMP